MNRVDAHPEALLEQLRNGEVLTKAEHEALVKHCESCVLCQMECRWIEDGLGRAAPTLQDEQRAKAAVAKLLGGHSQAWGAPSWEECEAQPASIISQVVPVYPPPKALGRRTASGRFGAVALAVGLSALCASSAAAVFSPGFRVWATQVAEAAERVILGGSTTDLASQTVEKVQRPALRRRTRKRPAVASVIEQEPMERAPVVTPLDLPVREPEVALIEGVEASPAIVSEAGQEGAPERVAPPLGRVLRRATQARGAGDVVKSRALLERLLRRAPQGAVAQTAHLALGQLCLHDLRDPQCALLHYRACLADVSDGGLREEAWVGVAEALGQLADADGEQGTWQALLAEFPGSIYQGRARQRLAELAGVAEDSVQE